ncbi:serine protease [Halobacillus andaensis]|uniref:Serine protease n=1 Tax=Halobacillus andaensis TaxID=1176239 RepID=A0A917EXU2_HALAA|nr:CAP domain-containing protein [Halobacillus andaensis]MBP2004604.1 putative YkwD family protein [Halobacillus andaensis]GGF20364.1 serine protease [Halobacillus andaensis]
MLKKYVLVFIGVLFMVSVATPALAEQMWKKENEGTATFEKWSMQIKDWLAERDVTVEEFESNLKNLFNPQELPATEDGQPKQRELHEQLKEEENIQDDQEEASESSLEAEDPSQFEEEVVELVNEERAKEDLEPLEMYDRLSDLARLKSQDMADNDYFDHTSPTYGSPFEMMDQYDFTYWSAGENIAAGQRSPEQVVEGWMNSPGHRENIMKEDFTHIGVGYVEESGDRYGTYWTQMFMTPRG